jgi:hypothetical protein
MNFLEKIRLIEELPDDTHELIQIKQALRFMAVVEENYKTTDFDKLYQKALKLAAVK